MNSSDIALVKASFGRLVPVADQLIPLFFARLFELDPQLRAVVAGNMMEQGRKLMSVVGQTIEALERPQAIVAILHPLSARPLGPGTKEEHYFIIGTACLWTLEKALGPEFTPAVRTAWMTVFTYVIHTLIQAQREGGIAA